MANFGQESKPIPLIAKISQETLADMIGTTRSRVSFFLNRFRDLGFIAYNGDGMQIHSSLVSVVLHGSMVQPSAAATPLAPLGDARDDVQTFGRVIQRRAGAAIEGAKRATLQFSLSRAPSSNLRSSLLKALSEKSARPASLSEFGRVELRSLNPLTCRVASRVHRVPLGVSSLSSRILFIAEPQQLTVCSIALTTKH